ncbi:UNVERIFIED_CONTAM: hypothetical protein FKN15_037598 [Acipenser sinensis]
MTGFLLGSIRLILVFVYQAPDCDQQDNRPAFIKYIHYMYVAACLFWITGIVTVVVSLLTPPPTKEQIRTTTIWGVWNKDVKLGHHKEESYKFTCKNPVDDKGTSEHKELPNGLHREKIVDGTDIKLLVLQDSSTPDCLTPCPSEDQTPMEHYGNGQASLMSGACEEDEQPERTSTCWKVVYWFCGLKGQSTKTPPRDPVEEEARCLEMLYEPPKIKLLLNIMLFVVCSLGVFLFVCFSL